MKSATLGIVDIRRTISKFSSGQWPLFLLWAGAVGALIGMSVFLCSGWDAKDYVLAIRDYSSYTSGQQNSGLAYSPLFMIFAFGTASHLPIFLDEALFWVVYFLGFAAQLWVGGQFAEGAVERKIIRYAAPVVAFFPGLLISDAVLSGNVAYVIYGVILCTALVGWKSENWNWFYLAVLGSTCVKFQMLTLVVIPLLSSKNRHWMRAVLTSAIATTLYAIQPHIWPRAFRTYTNSLENMALTRRDFGCGPIGNLARLLQDHGANYFGTCIAAYLLYASVLFLVLLFFAKQYREERITFAEWIPVMLLGVALLNPRILTYDVAWVTLPMVLLAWRGLREPDGDRSTLIVFAAMLLGANVFVEFNEDFVHVLRDAWKYIEMIILLGIFCKSAMDLRAKVVVEELEPMEAMPEPERELVLELE
jgi:hypothetical protein